MPEATVRIEADREVCIGAGLCVLAAPGVFDQSADDGRVVVRQARPEADGIEAAPEAVAGCPSGALSIHEGP
jgi:ferredoxin